MAIKSNIVHMDKVKVIWEPELITDRVLLKLLHRLLLIMDKEHLQVTDKATPEHLQVMVKEILVQQLIKPQQPTDMVKEEVQDMAKEEVLDMEKEDNQVT